MITESAFLDCENVPYVMASRFDQPWNFAGEVKGNHHRFLCHCTKCSRHNISYRHSSLCDRVVMEVVVLQEFLFVTDDMIEVMVYFGTCEKCDSVYWARSGPPFRRARACVPMSC